MSSDTYGKKREAQTAGGGGTNVNIAKHSHTPTHTLGLIALLQNKTWCVPSPTPGDLTFCSNPNQTHLKQLIKISRILDNYTLLEQTWN